MEFQGRVKQLLPKRSGTSQRTGNDWVAQPFIFEYFENQSDRYADSVILETFDTNVIENIREGMELRCGFGHKVRTYQKDSRDITINELRLYKIECVRSYNQPVQQANGSASEQQPTQKPQGGQEAENDNDLPF